MSGAASGTCPLVAATGSGGGGGAASTAGASCTGGASTGGSTGGAGATGGCWNACSGTSTLPLPEACSTVCPTVCSSVARPWPRRLATACLPEVREHDRLLRVEEVLHELEVPVHDVPDPLSGRRSVRCGGRGRLHGRGGVEPGDVPLVRIARVHGHPIHLWFGRSRLLDGRCLLRRGVRGSRAAAVDEPQRRRDRRTAADRLEPFAWRAGRRHDRRRAARAAGPRLPRPALQGSEEAV